MVTVAVVVLARTVTAKPLKVALPSGSGVASVQTYPIRLGEWMGAGEGLPLSQLSSCWWLPE